MYQDLENKKHTNLIVVANDDCAVRFSFAADELGGTPDIVVDLDIYGKLDHLTDYSMVYGSAMYDGRIRHGDEDVWRTSYTPGDSLSIAALQAYLRHSYDVACKIHYTSDPPSKVQ